MKMTPSAPITINIYIIASVYVPIFENLYSLSGV